MQDASQAGVYKKPKRDTIWVNDYRRRMQRRIEEKSAAIDAAGENPELLEALRADLRELQDGLQAMDLVEACYERWCQPENIL